MKLLSSFIALASLSIALGQSGAPALEQLNIGLNEDLVRGQLFDDRSGYILTEKANLYRLENEKAQLIKLPEHFVVEHAVFENKDEGIVIGTIEKEWINGITLTSDKASENKSTYNLFFEPVYYGHMLLPKDDTKTRIIGYTTNGGKTWTLTELKTNFKISGCTVQEHTYYISTRGPADHADGDVWRFEPSKNFLVSLYRIGRSLNGINLYQGNVVGYGTRAFGQIYSIHFNHLFWSKKRKAAFAEEERKNSKRSLTGEIIVFNDQRDYLKEFNIPGESEISALSIANDNTIWAVDTAGTFYFSSDTTIIASSLKLKDVKQIVIRNAQYGMILFNNGTLKEFLGAEKIVDYPILSETDKKSIAVRSIVPYSSGILILGTYGYAAIVHDP